MNRILGLSYLTILVVAVFAEERVSTTTTTQSELPCECSITEVAGLQNKLDSCHSKEVANTERFKICNENYAALNKSMEEKSATATVEANNWLDEKKKFQTQIASQGNQIAEFLQEKEQGNDREERNWSDEKKVMQTKLQNMETIITKSVEQKSLLMNEKKQFQTQISTLENEILTKTPNEEMLAKLEEKLKKSMTDTKNCESLLVQSTKNHDMENSKVILLEQKLAKLRKEKNTMEGTLLKAEGSVKRCEAILDENKKNYKEVDGKATLLETQKAELEKKYTTMKDQFAVATNDAQQCQSKIDKKYSNYEELLKKVASCETKHGKIEKKHAAKVKELRNQIAIMNKELGQTKKAVRATQDRYHDAREEMTSLDRELRMMHIRSRSTYFNTTLMKEDAVRTLHKTMDKSVKVAEDFIASKKTQSVYKKVKTAIVQLVDPMIPLYKKYILPQIEMIGKELRAIDAIEGVRLLVISMIEDGSRIGLNYIELTQDNNGGPRRFYSRLLRVLKYTRKNAGTVVGSACQLFLAYLGYKLFFLVLRTFIFCISLPFSVKRTKKIKTP